VPIFFSRFRRKHLLITTCIEKHCTRPLMMNVKQGSSDYQFFSLFVRLDKEIEPRFSDYEADALTTILTRDYLGSYEMYKAI